MEILKAGEASNDEEKIIAAKERIEILERQINQERERCASRPADETGTTIVQYVGIDVNVCKDLEAWVQKRENYKRKLALTDEDLEEMGLTRDRVRNILVELEAGIERLRTKCETASAGGGSGSSETIAGTTVTVVAVEAMKPVAVETGAEITDYYRIRVSKLMELEDSVDDKIYMLKEIRTEIDTLIKELIQTKESISYEEVEDLVEEIQVKPEEIEAGDVKVSARGKKVIAIMKTKKIEFIANVTNVIMNESGIIVEAPRITIGKDSITIDGKQVNITPSEVVKKVMFTPKKIKLMIKEQKAVYEASAEENRNLLGFIPVKINRNVVVDASDATVISDDKPWWYFFTTG
jgi:hypothetical protein